MMKAIQIKQFGPPRVLEVASVEVPEVSSTDILIQVAYAGVNPVDTYIREGAFVNLPDLPFIPGKDCSGVIKRVGRDVSHDFQVGDRVFVCKRRPDQYGTYAEYCLADQTDVFPFKIPMSYEKGAALGVPYFTAYRALFIKMKILGGETVLIHGASGAVGLASIQMAKKIGGCKVIGTAGTPDGMELVKNIGADYVLCHKERNYLDRVMEITDNKGVDVIIEMLANVNMQKDLEILAHRGRLAIVGSRGSTTIDPRSILGSEIEVHGVALMTSTEKEWKETATNIVHGINRGWLDPVIHQKYKLEDAWEAHRDIIQSTGAKGKLVLEISHGLPDYSQ